jgi:catechol 2,3-dioxygenase-like lactoylglutathione lyase family enzyme
VSAGPVAPEIAHLGPVEMFTPAYDESLTFFVEIMGMELVHFSRARTAPHAGSGGAAPLGR